VKSLCVVTKDVCYISLVDFIHNFIVIYSEKVSMYVSLIFIQQHTYILNMKMNVDHDEHRFALCN